MSNLSPREKQQLLSLIEKVYEVEQTPSFTQAINRCLTRTQFSIQNPPEDIELYRLLKTHYGPPTGRISRVITKQVYNQYLHKNTALIEYLKNTASKTQTDFKHLSDDELSHLLKQ